MPLEMPSGDDISALTDWVELRIAGGQDSLALARLNRLLKAEGSELADEELMEDEVESELGDASELEIQLPVERAAAAEVDVRVEQIRDEIMERQSIGTKLYPFTILGERVQERAACGADVYLLLLVLGSEVLPFRAERRAHEVEQVYDLIAMAALRRYLGRDARGLRFARTARVEDAEAAGETDDPDLRPTSFPKAIEWLRDHLDLGSGVRKAPDDESVGNQPHHGPHWEDAVPDLPPLGRKPLASYNDAGVDVVVWWRFADNRAGFPVLLAQCTVQITWEAKLEDIKLVLWEKWIDFDTVPPQRALVIPFADRRDHPNWRDRTSLAGTILDRVRLIELLNELECDQLEALITDEARTWTRTELAACA